MKFCRNPLKPFCLLCRISFTILQLSPINGKLFTYISQTQTNNDSGKSGIGHLLSVRYLNLI